MGEAEGLSMVIGDARSSLLAVGIPIVLFELCEGVLVNNFGGGKIQLTILLADNM